MTDRDHPWPLALAIYWVVAGAVCFLRLGATGLVSMEGMVADGARSMMESGDWVVPRVYGEIYTYKPALAYWLAALPQTLADPPPEWLLRLPFAASGFVMGLLVLILIGRAVGPRAGLFCALASISTGLFIQKVRIAEYDTAVAAGVGVAVAAACCNLSSRRPRAGLWLLCYLALAFGFLAKGTPALMVYGPGLLAAGLVTGRWRRLLELRHIVAALLFVGLVGGYLVLAYRSVGPQAFEQPIAEAGVRGVGWRLDQGETTTTVATLLRSVAKPALIGAAFLPWSVLLPFSLLLARRRHRADDPSALLLLSAGAFLMAGTLAFMATPTHEMRYYLPLCVPAGILCGMVAAGVSDLRPRAQRNLHCHGSRWV